MADDVDAPHEDVYDLAELTHLAAFLKAIREERYLPHIQGGRATWVVLGLGPVAVMAQQWPEPRLLAPAQSLISEICNPDGPGFEFKYAVQRDPAEVFAILSINPKRTPWDRFSPDWPAAANAPEPEESVWKKPLTIKGLFGKR